MGKGRGTCSGQGRLESSDKLPRCFSGPTHRSQQPEWGCSLLCPPPACVWGCAGWHGAGPVGTIRTATLTVSAFKTEMHLVPCEREGKEGTVHTVCRRERCRACGEAKRPTVVSPVTCLVYGTRWLILACSSRWCSPSRWELQTADHLVSAAELLLWSEETRIFKYMSPRQWCYLGEHYGVSRRCSLVGGSTSVGAGFESS